MTADFQFFLKKRIIFFLFFVLFVFFLGLAAVTEAVTVNVAEVLLICPAEAGHAAILNRSPTIACMLNAVHGNPDVGVARSILLEWTDLNRNLVRNVEKSVENLAELWRIDKVAYIVVLAILLELAIVVKLPDGT